MIAFAAGLVLFVSFFSPGSLLRAHPGVAGAPPAQDTSSSATDNPNALTARALQQRVAGDTAGAQALLTRALAISPNHPGANDALGELLLAEHHYPEAMDRFETVLAINLRDPAARAGELKSAVSLALEARRAGNPGAAYLCLQHAQDHLPDDAMLLTDLAQQAQQMHLRTQAEQAVAAAVALKPTDPPVLYALARVEIDLQHLPAAEQHLRAYLSVHPEDATAHFGLGHVLTMEQRIDEARAEFERSVSLQPVQTESYYQLGQMALDAGQPDTAAPLFAKTLARDPHHGGALTGLGILAYRQKDYATARQQLTLATQSSPDYQPAHYYLGLTLARLGEKIDADRELRTATELAQKQDPHASPLPQPPLMPTH